MICKHFGIKELVTPGIHQARGEKAWELLDRNALITLDALREAFGPIIVNNWHRGGSYKESGLRDFFTSTGAQFSQHKLGRAFDCKFAESTPQQVYAEILAGPERFPLLTCLEDIRDTASWLHFDTRNHSSPGTLIVRS